MFYNDALVFGGHEVTALHAVKFMLRGKENKIHFVFSAENTRLKTELLKIESVSLVLHTLSFSFRIKSYLLNFLNPVRIKELSTIIAEIGKVEALIAVQGSIEISSFGVYMARKIGVRTISFIPLCYQFKITSKRGSSIGLPYLRDRIAKYLYRMPDFFITVNDISRRQLLIREGIDSSKVHVAYCGVDDRILSLRRSGSRERKVVGLVGRVEFGQKNQLFLVEFLNRYWDRVHLQFEFVVIGDGKDLGRLKKSIIRNGLEDKLKISPWESDPTKLYQMIDILVIPSFFEGIPLVLYEAMCLRIPILASNLPGHLEMLPVEALFDVGDFESFFNMLTSIFSIYTEAVLMLQEERIRSHHTIDTFGESFENAVVGFLSGGNAI